MEMFETSKCFQVYSLNFPKNTSPYLLQISIKEHCPALYSITNEKANGIPFHFKNIDVA